MTKEPSFMSIKKFAPWQKKVHLICEEVENRLNKVHIDCFKGMDKPLFLISEAYPGIWLEHVYDSVFLAEILKILN